MTWDFQCATNFNLEFSKHRCCNVTNWSDCIAVTLLFHLERCLPFFCCKSVALRISLCTDLGNSQTFGHAMRDCQTGIMISVPNCVITRCSGEANAVERRPEKSVSRAHKRSKDRQRARAQSRTEHQRANKPQEWEKETFTHHRGSLICR